MSQRIQTVCQPGDGPDISREHRSRTRGDEGWALRDGTCLAGSAELDVSGSCCDLVHVPHLDEGQRAGWGQRNRHEWVLVPNRTAFPKKKSWKWTQMLQSQKHLSLAAAACDVCCLDIDMHFSFLVQAIRKDPAASFPFPLSCFPLTLHKQPCSLLIHFLCCYLLNLLFLCWFQMLRRSKLLLTNFLVSLRCGLSAASS